MTRIVLYARHIASKVEYQHSAEQSNYGLTYCVEGQMLGFLDSACCLSFLINTGRTKR